MADEKPNPIDKLFTPDTTPKEDRPDPSAEFRKGFLDDKGALRGEDVLKAAWENKRDRDRLAGQVSELEKAAKDGVGEDVEAYLQGFDKEALGKAAPKAYRGEADDPALKALVDSARLAGVPVARAQDLVGKYYAAINENMPEPDKTSAAERRAAAIKAHPNGDVVASDVQMWLQAHQKAHAFTDKEAAVLGTLLESSEGLSVLWRLQRRASPAPADLSTHGRATVDPEGERREVMKLLGTPPGAEWEKIKADVLRRYEALPQQS